MIHGKDEKSVDDQSPPNFFMSRSSPPFPTSFRLSSTVLTPNQRQIRLSTEYFSPTPILRFTVGKFSQLPTADGPEVAILGRSNVGVLTPLPYGD